MVERPSSQEPGKKKYVGIFLLLYMEEVMVLIKMIIATDTTSNHFAP